MRRLGTLGFALFGSPEHVAARRAGALWEDDHLIGWDEAARSLPAARWVERALRDRPPALTTTTLAGQLAAARVRTLVDHLADLVRRQDARLRTGG